MKTLTLSSALMLALPPLAPAFATPTISGDAIRIGLMSDMSGPYADNCGPSSVAAAQIAIEEFGGQIGGKPIELITADDQNKPDIGMATALRWIDNDGIDSIVTCSITPVVLGIQERMNAAKKPYMLAGSAATEATNSKCNAYTSNWAYDTYSSPKATVEAMMSQGLDTFFFITVDITFGKVWEEDAARFIEAAGGKVLGASRHPLNTTDFSGQLLAAQASGAKVIAIANAGSDLANVVKQAAEYEISTGGQVVAPLTLLLNTVHGIGLEATKGLTFATLGYWDQSEETRAIGEKFAARLNGRYPNEFQIATYSAVKHYLSAVEALQSDDGEAVNTAMRATKVNDAFTKDVAIRADGLVMRPYQIAKVVAPESNPRPWAYYELQETLPAQRVWRPVSESTCPLVK